MGGKGQRPAQGKQRGLIRIFKRPQKMKIAQTIGVRTVAKFILSATAANHHNSKFVSLAAS